MAGGKTSGDPSLHRADFEAIEAAVMETARGRWFLAEFARRHRGADTAAVLEAIARIEATLAERPTALAPPREPTPPPPRLPELDLNAVAEHLLRSRQAFDAPDAEAVAEEAIAETGTPAPEPEPDIDDPWPPEDSEPPARHLTPMLVGEPVRDMEPLPDVELVEAEEDAAVPEEELAAWEEELVALNVPRRAEASTEVVSFARSAETVSIRTLKLPDSPQPMPPTRPAAPPPPPAPRATAAVTIAVAKPVAAIAPRPERPQPKSAPQPKPGPRIDDPTLTMTRDEKLALFS